jgi:hypothetical protein
MSVITLEPPALRRQSGRAHVVLPEPPPNRAQPVHGSVIARWLQDISNQDQHGYAVISGGGRTFVVLYCDSSPRAAAVIRGGMDEDGPEALRLLADCLQFEHFAVTHRLGADVVSAASGLFQPAQRVEQLERPAAELKALLAGLIVQRFSGAVVVEAPDGTWAVMLAHDGRLLGSYGTDDRTLKPSIDDVPARTADRGRACRLGGCSAGRRIGNHAARSPGAARPGGH